MFHEKFKSANLFVIQKRLFTALLVELMRLHQMRITSYFKPISNNHYFFYHFIIHANSHNITPFYARKWKPTSRLMTSKSLSYSINEKSNRFFITNFATSSFTSSFTHSFPTSTTSKISFMKNTLVFNKKFAESKLMCHSTEFEINSFKNMNVVSFKFFRKCRHCKQFFIFKNLFHKHISHCNKSIKELKHVKKLNDS